MSASYARQISEKEAIAVAEKFMVGEFGLKAPMRSAPGKPGTATTDNQPYYVFNADDDKGFVIVSGDDRARKILGYADKGHFDADNIPPQLSWLLGEYTNQIATLPSSAPTDPSWTQTTASRAANEVLLETANWGQDAPYNALTPVINGHHASTGCVATAMAIIMKYHNWPPKGVGSNSYVSYDGTNLSYNFETSFDWNNMLMDYSTESTEQEKEAVAKLMYACGISVNMMYTPSSSASNALYVSPALSRFLGYSIYSEYLTLNKFTSQEWTDIIHNEIDNNRPFLISGNNGIAGHIFVCDGYDDNNMIHINWGWNGSYNGYFYFDDLSPFNSYSFNNGLEIITNIKPTNTKFQPSPITFYTYPHENGLSSNVSDFSNGNPFNIYATRIGSIDQEFNGEIAVALLNGEESIKEIISTQEVTINDAQQFIFKDCVIKNSQIGQDDIITIMYRTKDNEKWEKTVSCSDGPYFYQSSFAGRNHLPVKYYTPQYSVINYDVDSRVKVDVYVSDILSNPSKVLYGERISIKFTPIQDVKYIENVNLDNRFKDDDGSYYDIYVGQAELDINVRAFDQSQELSKTYHVEIPGTLNQLCIEDPTPIVNLKLTGNIDRNDFYYIRNNMPLLRTLDLSETIVSEEEIPEVVIDKYETKTGAFYKAGELKQISLPINTKTIKSQSFRESGLEEISFNDGLEIIESNAFLDCGIKKLYLNDLLKSIGNSAFGYCNEIESIYSPNFIPPVMGEGVFDDLIYDLSTLYVPKGSKAAYEKSEGWKDFSNILEIDFSGIDDVEISKEDISNMPCYVYNLSGICISKGKCLNDLRNNLPTGIYVLRFGNGNTRKITIK